MTELLAGGRAIDFALLVVAAEFVALLVVRRRVAPGLRPLDVVGQLLSGALLLLALRTALTGGDARWVAALLAASFPAHLFDMVRRMRQSKSVSA